MDACWIVDVRVSDVERWCIKTAWQVQGVPQAGSFIKLCFNKLGSINHKSCQSLKESVAVFNLHSNELLSILFWKPSLISIYWRSQLLTNFKPQLHHQNSWESNHITLAILPVFQHFVHFILISLSDLSGFHSTNTTILRTHNDLILVMDHLWWIKFSTDVIPQHFKLHIINVVI